MVVRLTSFGRRAAELLQSFPKYISTDPSIIASLDRSVQSFSNRRLAAHNIKREPRSVRSLNQDRKRSRNVVSLNGKSSNRHEERIARREKGAPRESRRCVSRPRSPCQYRACRAGVGDARSSMGRRFALRGSCLLRISNACTYRWHSTFHQTSPDLSRPEGKRKRSVMGHATDGLDDRRQIESLT